jgi:hypothetical protein
MKKTICFYNAEKVNELFLLIEEYKKQQFIKGNKMPTLDDIATTIFIPALQNNLK